MPIYYIIMVVAMDNPEPAPTEKETTMRHYSGDPRWLTLKWPGKCTQCGAVMAAGLRAFRYKDGSLFGDECGCGDQHEREFLSAAADEEAYAGTGDPYAS